MTIDKARELFGRNERGLDNVARIHASTNNFCIIMGVSVFIGALVTLFFMADLGLAAPISLSAFAIVCLMLGFFYHEYHLLSPQELPIKSWNYKGVIVFNPKTGVTCFVRDDRFNIITDDKRSVTVMRFESGTLGIDRLYPTLIIGNDGYAL